MSAETRRFRVGSLGTIDAPRAIDAVRRALAEGRLKNGTVYVWPEDTERRARITFEVHGGEVLTRTEFDERARKLELEHLAAEHRASQQRETGRLAGFTPEQKRRLDDAKALMETARSLASWADLLSWALEHEYSNAHAGLPSSGENQEKAREAAECIRERLAKLEGKP